MSSPNERALLFDRVLIQRGSTWVTLSVDAFFALPLSERIRHVIERTVAFQLNGTDVDQKNALAELRRMRAPA